MLMESQQSCLLIIDVQQKLTPHVRDHEELVENCQWLMKLARELDIPLLVSEQYPKGLGPSLAAIQEFAADTDFLEKVHFSCGSDRTCTNRINDLKRKQIVIAGIEAHVCVLQTALELSHLGFEVFVVADAINSRHKQDYKFAIKRMLAQGIHVVTREMVFFEWVHQAGTERFKTLSKTLLK